MTKREELAANWPVVLAAFVGVMTGAWAFPVFILGPLIKPFEAEFAWSRTGIVACTSFLAAGLVIATPIAGRLADRIGVRVVAMTSMVMLVLCFGVMSMIGGALWHLQLLYFFMGFLGAGCGGVAYTRAIGGWFRKARGLALGITLTGTGVASAVAPNLVEFVNAAAGWRWVCIIVAGITLLVGLPIVFFGLREPLRVGQVIETDDSNCPVSLIGATRAEALRDPRFYILAATIGIFGLVISSLLVHTVPMLIDMGMTPTRAAQIASFSGISIIIGRLSIGWMLDRYSPTAVGIVIFVLGSVGCLLFVLLGAGAALITVAAIGFLVGAEIDLLSFMVLRYFGLLNYGAIYGILFGVYSGAGIMAPLVAGGLIWWGGYNALFIGAASTFLTAAFLFFVLGFMPTGKNWEL
jgi:MFS family permease